MSRRFKIVLLMTLSLLVFSSSAFAAADATFRYDSEIDLGGGWWQYNYTFTNNSTAGEYLYSVYFDFDTTRDEVGLALGSGWDGVVWMGSNTTNFIDTYATEGNDLASGSALSGFNFKVNYRAAVIPYTAYFDDHSGETGFSTTSGLTIPEPISSLLFLAGGATFVVRGYIKRKKYNL